MRSMLRTAHSRWALVVSHHLRHYGVRAASPASALEVEVVVEAGLLEGAVQA